MKTKEILKGLLNGEQFGNERGDWIAICKPDQNLFWIIKGGNNFFYKSANALAKRINQLINRGY